jgi:hypothetical protein
MMAGGFSDSREVRVTVEVVDGFTSEGKEKVLFKEEFLLGSLEEGLDPAADVEQVLDDLEESHLADKEEYGVAS